jgi:hypothetical protein
VVDERALERFMPQGKSSAAARALAPRTIAILKAWMLSPEHVEHPYPTDAEKEALALQCGISVRQVSVWMTNARKRIWMPLRQRGTGGGAGSRRGWEGAGYASAADGGGGPQVGGKRAAGEGRGLRARPGGPARSGVRGSRTSDDAEGYGEEGDGSGFGEESGGSGVGDSEEAHAHEGILMLHGAGAGEDDDGDDEEGEAQEEADEEEEDEDDRARGRLAGLAAVGARHGYSSGPQAKRPRRGSRPQEGLTVAGAAGAAEAGSHPDAGSAGAFSATASAQASPSDAAGGLHRGARSRSSATVAGEGGGAGSEPSGGGSAAGKGAKGAKGGKGWVRSLSHTSLESASSAAGMSLSTVAAALPAAPPVDLGSALSGGGGGSAGAALAAGGQLHGSGAGTYSGADASQVMAASLHHLQAALPPGFALVCVSPDPLTTVGEPADAAAAAAVRALQNLAASNLAAVTAGANPADAQALLKHLSEQLSVAEPFVDRVLQSTAQHVSLLQQRLFAAQAVCSRLSALREAVRHSTVAAAAGAAPPQAGSGSAGAGGLLIRPAGASSSRPAAVLDTASLHAAEASTPGWLPQGAAANLTPALLAPGGLVSASGVAPPLPAGETESSGGPARPPR